MVENIHGNTIMCILSILYLSLRSVLPDDLGPRELQQTTTAATKSYPQGNYVSYIGSVTIASAELLFDLYRSYEQ